MLHKLKIFMENFETRKHNTVKLNQSYGSFKFAVQIWRKSYMEFYSVINEAENCHISIQFYML